MALLEDRQTTHDERTARPAAELPRRRGDEPAPDDNDRRKAKDDEPSWRERARAALDTMRRHPIITAAGILSLSFRKLRQFDPNKYTSKPR